MANYQDSPFGTGIHIHVNKPDSKFKPDAPEFKVDLALDGEAALTFKDLVDAQCEAAFENFKETEQYAKMKPKDQRELKVYYPYEEEEDDNGDKTGRIIFQFKQNARIKLRDGTFKEIKIGMYDAKGKEFNKLIRSGSELRIKYSFRAIPMPQLKQVGIRMDFMGVQVRKLSQGGGSGGGFGAVDGYEDDGQAFAPADDQQDDNTPSSDNNADY